MFRPETIEQCEQHYLEPDREFICCKDFGSTDGMNGSCHWCLEMIPYQWHMCQDDSLKRSLEFKGMTKEEAISFIETRKQELFGGIKHESNNRG